MLFVILTLMKFIFNFCSIYLFVIFIAIGAICPISIYSQEQKKEKTLTFFKVETQYRAGFILPHHASIKYLVNDFSRGFDISLSKNFSGNKIWHHLYRNPEFGVAFNYFNLGNNKVLGSAYSLYGFTQLSLSNKSKSLFIYQLGLGFAYLSKIYNSENNYYNIAIGSHLNALIDIQLSCPLRFNRFILKPGISFTHFSNGSWTKPNLGLNIINARLALAFKNKNFEKINVQFLEPQKFISYFYYTCNFSVGNHQLFPLYSPHYFVYTLGLNAYYRINYKYSLGLGFNEFFDFALKNEINKKGSWIRTGMHLGMAVQFGKIGLKLKTGYYLIDDYKVNGNIYNQLIIETPIYKNNFIFLGIKSHSFVADYFELGTFFILNYKKE